MISRKPMTSVELRSIATPESALGILLDFYYLGARTIGNPDRVLRYESKGRNILLYQDMEDRDSRIRSCLQTRKNSVLSLPKEIQAGGETKKDLAIAEFVRHCLFEHIQDFDQDLFELLDGIAKGFAISEVDWEVCEGTLKPKCLRSITQERIHFGLDGAIRLLDNTNMVDGAAVPDFKFLYFVFQPQNENPYGTSVLRSVYWPYWFKKNVVKFWLLDTERFGGIVHGSYPSDKGDAFKTQLLDDLSKLSGYQAFIYPDWAAVSFENAGRGDSAAKSYALLTDFCNLEIAQGILGQSASIEGTTGRLGNEALQMQVLNTLKQADAVSLMGVINHQLIRWMVDLNFVLPSGSNYPKLKIHHEDVKDLRLEVIRDKMLISDMGLPVGHKWLYTKYNTPEPQPDEPLALRAEPLALRAEPEVK